MGFSLLLKKASLAGAFFVPAIWLSVAEATCPVPGPLPVVRVQQVVDGDTVRLVDGRSVRLIGINAPEIGRKGRATEPFAEAARQRLQALVAQNSGEVALREGEESKDRYGRTLAHLYGRNGQSFEAQLLSEGLAYQVAIAPNVDLISCLQAAENAARQSRQGLWRDTNVQAAGSIRQSGFALVSGRVDEVERNRGGVWIEIQGGLVLRVAPNVLGRFDEGFWSNLEGRQIEVRGWIVDRSRRGGLKPGQSKWLLPITDPAMMKLQSR